MSRGSSPPGIVVTGIGVVTSVGAHAPQALSSITAGICRFRELDDFEPEVRDPGQYFPSNAVGAPADAVASGLLGVERLLALGRPALQEALADAEIDDADLTSTDLYVAGTERGPAPERSREAVVLPARLLGAVARQTAPAASRYFPSGSAGALLALQAGMARLERGECRYCVVGGVDSWLDPETLAAVDQARRLKTEEVQDGFVPGEAGAFVVIERASDAARRGRVPYARCNDVYVGREEHTIEKMDSVCTAQGLTECLRLVVERLRGSGRSARVALCDLNGESYRSTEWAYALTRTFAVNQDAAPAVVHPADCIGDTGAASGAVLLALAARGIRRRRRDWDPVLIWCSSDKGTRAACSMESV